MKRKGLFTILCILTIFCFSCKGQMNSNEEKDEKIYLSIKYHSDRGYQIPGQVTIEYGSILTAEHLPELYNYDNAYVFRGWYTDKNFNENRRVQIGYKITANLDLYAKWEAKEEEIITYYTVRFDTRVYGYISGSQSQIVQEGGYAYIPETPVPYTEYSEYIFDGWYTDEECTNPFNFNSPITSNMTLYAKWKLNITHNEYTVQFNTLGYGYMQDSCYSQIVQAGGYAYIPETPIPYTEYSEYIFDGWYTDEECSNSFDFNSPITSNITLYAKWKSDMSSVKISLAESSDISISKSTNDSFIMLTVLSGENTNFIWRIDGINQEEASNSLIIDTRNLTRGTHAVSVVVILSDNSYKSAMIYITVEE